jgi:hypothetical protein
MYLMWFFRAKIKTEAPAALTSDPVVDRAQKEQFLSVLDVFKRNVLDPCHDPDHGSVDPATGRLIKTTFNAAAPSTLKAAARAIEQTACCLVQYGEHAAAALLANEALDASYKHFPETDFLSGAFYERVLPAIVRSAPSACSSSILEIYNVEPDPVAELQLGRILA